MRIYFVLCFALVAFTQVQLGLAGLPGPPGRKGPTGPKGVPPPYCQVSSKITDFLKQFRSTSLKGAASGEKGSAGSTSSMNYKWVYNCLHAGFNFQHLIFEVPIYQCCQQCEFPDFSHCMRSAGAVAQCNSEALRCIARCINNKGPTTGQPGPPGPPGPKKCPVKRKKVPGGSDCLERSCIHV